MQRALANASHGGPTAAVSDTETTRFDYLFANIADDPDKHLPVTVDTVKNLRALGQAMFEVNRVVDGKKITDEVKNRSCIPPIYTYWGQFLDHDITANTDRNEKKNSSDITVANLEPRDPEDVKKNMRNLREPALNLDSVYGDGPPTLKTGPFVIKPALSDNVVPYIDEIKLKVGNIRRTGPIAPRSVNIPRSDEFHDLPRREDDPTNQLNGRALTGDGRNDKNLIVAQIHVAFLRFHNAAVDWVRENEPEVTDIFERARNLTRWSYQWITVHDYLRTVTIDSILDNVLNKKSSLLDMGNRGTYMPLEFSVAAFRFGHTMIREEYDWNRNFGPDGKAFRSPLNLLFLFTGKSARPGRLGGGSSNKLPFNWIAEWDRMVDKNSTNKTRFARKIDTLVTPQLKEMLNEIDTPSTTATDLEKLLKSLPERNLLRGYLLSLPTGQAVAEELGITPLTSDELVKDNGNPNIKAALEKGGFVEKTPLWFYILKESEVRAKGQSLGEVGSTIVAETIIGQLLNDPTSYMNRDNWAPDKGVRMTNGAPVKSIADFFRFAGVLPPHGTTFG